MIMMNKILIELKKTIQSFSKFRDIVCELGLTRSELSEKFIEQETRFGQIQKALSSQATEQETRMTSTQALLLNQQQLLIEKIDRLQQDLNRLIALQESSSSIKK